MSSDGKRGARVSAPILGMRDRGPFLGPHDGEFERCTLGRRTAAFSAGGWGGSVAGDIGCDAAGGLIQHHFNRDFGQSQFVGSQAEEIRQSDPGRFKSAGYDCASFPLPDGYGWHMLCTRGANQISFFFTP